MKFIRGIKNIPPMPQGTVLTIGNFDGVHLGHQSIISRVREKSCELGLPSCVVFFEPSLTNSTLITFSASGFQKKLPHCRQGSL